MNEVNSKRVALVIPDMRIGGAEKIALVLARELDRLGHKVDLVVSMAQGELIGLLPAGVTVVDLHATRFRNLIRPLKSYFQHSQPDVALVFMWPLNVIAIIAHRLARARGSLIVSDHITLSEEFADRGRAFQALLAKSIRWTYPYADRRVLVSEAAADDLAAISGFDRAGLTVISNPIDTSEMGAGSLDETLLWRDSSPRILTVGRLKPQKNHRLLLEAFAMLVRQRPAQLVILGEGDLATDLANQTEALAIADRVVFAGAATNPWPYYRSADLFVLSSDFEGFGNVLVEAMIAGLRVVSTDCQSGPREILDDGRFGRLVPVGNARALADAMLLALDAPHDPAQMIERAEAVSGNSVQRYIDLMIGAASSVAQR